jgi:hypothetical protein
MVADWPGEDQVLNPLRLYRYTCWSLLEVQKSRLIPSALGDIDILAGRLDWNDPDEFERALAAVKKEVKGKWHPSNIWLLAALRLANSGGLGWPPPMDWLVAIEAKCAYLNQQADSISRKHLKSTKASAQKVAHLRKQVNSLLKLGFNRVALLDIIASPPVSGPSGGAWVTAAAVANETRRAMSHDLEKRLPEDSPAGHCVYSIGAVAGGDEASRAAVSADWRRAALENPLLVDAPVVRAHRKQIEENLVKIFQALPKPLNLRAAYCDCPDCKQVHLEGKPCSN